MEIKDCQKLRSLLEDFNLSYKTIRHNDETLSISIDSECQSTIITFDFAKGKEFENLTVETKL